MANRIRTFFAVLLVVACGVGIMASGAPVELVEEAPRQITTVAPGVALVDFGRVAFGNLRVMPPAPGVGKITVCFGEALAEGRINRHPPGSVRFARVEVLLKGEESLVVAPPANRRNTGGNAVTTPPAWGTVLPFRWVEIEGWPGEVRPEDLRRCAAFASGWNDQASAFHCSDEMLNRVWELCRYSIKATTFAGVYVDGDRERISYEADAYLSQLGQYFTEGDPQMARDTFERLVERPTWPTEWAAHMIFMAQADWMETGDIHWLAAHYESLKPKLHLERERADGLIVSSGAQMKHDDMVDWPVGERDGYVSTPVNTVENAFHLRSLTLMAELARALRKDPEAADYEARERRGEASFQARLFDPARGLYRDGEGTGHVSLHANLFPLAFGLVPAGNRAPVARWLGERGMACSVYAAQYLLAGLFENDEATNAMALMTAANDRSWRHMVESGATITWEAWDARYKPNLDWNHAWGAAPANLLPHYVLGVRPLTPGWGSAEIWPHPGTLTNAEGQVPTPRGAIQVSWVSGDTFKLSLTLPSGMGARVCVPAPEKSRGVRVGGEPVPAQRVGRWWRLDREVTGAVMIES